MTDHTRSIRLSGLKAAPVALLALFLGACATIPQPIAGDAAQFSPILANQATPQSVGQRVRWGGVLVSTEPQTNQTCLEVLARELDRSARPIVRNDVHFGRFMACGPGFRDPAVYTEGREVTLIGELSGFSDGLIGEYTYRYPMVTTQSLYLWPERSEKDDLNRGYAGFYPGFWGPYNYPVQRVYVPVPRKAPDSDN